VKFFSISGGEKAKLQTARPSKLGAPLSITRRRARVFPRVREASYLVIWSFGHLVIWSFGHLVIWSLIGQFSDPMTK
jgi:hypothetical protein